jgi:hypothetical protein
MKPSNWLGHNSLLILLIFALATGSGRPATALPQAGDYYVATNGDDGSGDGSSAKPWASATVASRTCMARMAVRYCLAGLWETLTFPVC